MTVSAAVGTARTTLSRRERLKTDPTYQAFWLLRIGFTVAPIVFGADKFADLLTNWDKYLAPWVSNLLPGTPHQIMYGVGVIEIVAGVAVLVKPRFGGYIVAAWLLGIIVNLVSIHGYYDVALRDFGLLLAALTLARLAKAFGGDDLLGRAQVSHR
ncbi:MAG TPA: hypothetical protein VH520_09350 [Streptosporangiaceae bacterium]|jgi:uncharacterized membrane protein YphA (DoxX/SURF4 family)